MHWEKVSQMGCIQLLGIGCWDCVFKDLVREQECQSLGSAHLDEMYSQACFKLNVYYYERVTLLVNDFFPSAPSLTHLQNDPTSR